MKKFDTRIGELGGWLAFLVFSLMFLGPQAQFSMLLYVVRDAVEHSPKLIDSSQWQGYKRHLFLIFSLSAAISFTGGYRLWKIRSFKSIRLAIFALWFSWPVGSALCLFVAPLEILGEHPLNILANITILWAIGAGIGTAYLANSARVKNTYVLQYGSVKEPHEAAAVTHATSAARGTRAPHEDANWLMIQGMGAIDGGELVDALALFRKAWESDHAVLGELRVLAEKQRAKAERLGSRDIFASKEAADAIYALVEELESAPRGGKKVSPSQLYTLVTQLDNEGYDPANSLTITCSNCSNPCTLNYELGPVLECRSKKYSLSPDPEEKYQCPKCKEALLRVIEKRHSMKERLVADIAKLPALPFDIREGFIDEVSGIRASPIDCRFVLVGTDPEEVATIASPYLRWSAYNERAPFDHVTKSSTREHLSFALTDSTIWCFKYPRGLTVAKNVDNTLWVSNSFITNALEYWLPILGRERIAASGKIRPLEVPTPTEQPTTQQIPPIRQKANEIVWSTTSELVDRHDVYQDVIYSQDGCHLARGAIHEHTEISGSSRFKGLNFGNSWTFYRIGSMQVMTFSRRYSSSRSPYDLLWMTRILLLKPSTNPNATLFSGLQ